MNFDKLVEAIIKEAQDRGEFNNLPGKGKHIDLSAYFETPEETRVAQSVLKNAGMSSPEAELLQEIEGLKKLLPRAVNENKKLEIRKEIEHKQIEFRLMIERQSHQRRKK